MVGNHQTSIYKWLALGYPVVMLYDVWSNFIATENTSFWPPKGKLFGREMGALFHGNLRW